MQNSPGGMGGPFPPQSGSPQGWAPQQGAPTSAQQPGASIQGAPYSGNPQQAAAPYGANPQQAAAPYGANPQQAAAPYGANPQQAAAPYGANPQQAAAPYGANPQQAAAPYGANPQQAAGPYGAPPSPAGQLPMAGAPAAGAGTSGWGFDLNQDERVLWGIKRSYTGDKISFWILGVLFAVVLIGIYFIYKALTIERDSPRALALTNQRFVIVDGSGSITSHFLNQFVDLFPKRAQAQARGGGLLGALVVAAVSAGLNALAARNEKIDPKYWVRTVGVTFKTREGRDVFVDLRPNEAQAVGPMLARCILLGEGQAPGAAPGVAPGAAPGALGAPMGGYAQPTPYVPPVPSDPGIGMQIGGWVLLVLSSFIAYGAVRGLVVYFNIVGVFMLMVSLAMLAGSVALHFFGSKKNWAAAEAKGKKPNKIVPLAIPGAFFAIATLLIVAGSISRYLSYRAIEERYRTSSKSTATSTATPVKTAAPTSTLPTTGGVLSPASIDLKLQSEGFKFESGKSLEKGEQGGAPTWGWFVNHPTRSMAWVKLYDFTNDLNTKTAPLTAYNVGSKCAVSVAIEGTGASLDHARALAAILTGKSVSSGAQVTTALAGAGWKLDRPMGKDDTYTFGHRTFLAFAKKGGQAATIQVLDYSKAASGKDETVVQVIDRRVLLVSASSGGNPVPSQELARKLTGR